MVIAITALTSACRRVDALGTSDAISPYAKIARSRRKLICAENMVGPRKQPV